MTDPVMDPEGNTYDRSAIEEWLRMREQSPITRAELRIDQLVPNRALKAAIDDERNSLPAMHPSAAPMDINVGFVAPEARATAELSLELTSVAAEKVLTELSPGEKRLVMASVVAPASLGRTPVDIIMCIDVSGSMGMNASAEGVESSGLNMLDIVKHAVKTVITTMNDNDRISIVTYSSAATLVCPLVQMTSTGKSNTIGKVESLREGGMTNLWDGLKVSLDELFKRSDSEIFGGTVSSSRAAAIYLLTDGVPNLDPPRGYIPAMQRYRDQNGGHYPGIINTFGFGYNLKSQLLLEIATEGQGTYAFIPDSGFVGTVFVNALGNTLTTVSENVVMSFSAEMDSVALSALCSGEVFPPQTEQDTLHFRSHTVQVGQPIGRVALLSSATLPALLTNIKYTDSGNQSSLVASVTGPHEQSSEIDEQEVAAEYFRLCTVELIAELLILAKPTVNEVFPNKCATLIQNLVARIDDWLANTTACAAKPVPGETRPQATSRAKVEALKEDITGQITEATSKEEWYKKWGEHFLRSIMRAHQLKQCNNFKDPGVQVYGNTLFESVRDAADDIFSALPPPVPSDVYGGVVDGGGGGGGQGSGYVSVNMSSYNDRNAGCFHGLSSVTMRNGNTKQASAVRAGDELSSGTVRCVVKSIVRSNHMMLIRLPASSEDSDSLLITPYHPVQWAGRWRFPRDVPGAEWIDVPCDAVYSFLVDSACVARKFASSALVNGVPTAMLAHGVTGDACLSHPFFGTSAIVDALQTCKGFTDGLVLFSDAGYFVRDGITGMVSGINDSLSV